MPRRSSAFALLGVLCLASEALAQPAGAGSALLRGVADAPVTDAMLREPAAADWLRYSRTYDAQRYSPLDEIDRDNVASLALMAVVTWQLGRAALVDAPTVALAALALVLLQRTRINSAWIVLGGAAVGLAVQAG